MLERLARVPPILDPVHTLAIEDVDHIGPLAVVGVDERHLQQSMLVVVVELVHDRQRVSSRVWAMQRLLVVDELDGHGIELMQRAPRPGVDHPLLPVLGRTECRKRAAAWVAAEMLLRCASVWSSATRTLSDD
jgi:hypothetical protein